MLRASRAGSVPSVCVRGCVSYLSESSQYFVSAGQKRIFESNSEPQALFLGSKNILHAVVKSSLLVISRYWHIQWFQEQVN